ncbi:uncharacterized protein LOC103855620 [Brassica rapa]|uniref:uncharacterized protein LOC103855620 n=1 Tax=Brassica campestris TaxID=3711 RepID=UPI00142E6C5F|nr:uncharacterized protein LOC103855620 [Brassica rapa]
MGEGEYFSGNDYTMVFWNMDDYPIPVGMDDFGSIRINIVEALERFGYHGEISIDVHCEQLECDVRDELSKARIYYLPEATKVYLTSTAVNKVCSLDMTAFLVRIALPQPPINIAVIAKPKAELVRVLKCLKSRGHTLMLIHPPDGEQLSFSVDTLLAHAHLGDSKEEEEDHPSQGEEEDHLSKGEEEDHLSKGEEDTSVGLGPYYYYCQYLSQKAEKEKEKEEEVEDPYKILDFLEPIRPTVKGAMTAVFWDAQYCPFPPGSTPDEIYHSIESALVERKFTNKTTIWAYLGDGDKNGSALLGDKTWASRIYFFSAGDKASRRIRMTNDICFWAHESSRQPVRESLFIVSDQFRGDLYYVELLHNLVPACLHLFCITPTQDINKPESPEWPGLFFDQGAYRLLLEISEIPAARCCSKKRKTDAGMLFMMEDEEETSGMESNK